MRVVSSAKRGGGVDCLYPNRDPREAPWFLVSAVSHALSVLGWMELQEKHQPPERIWLNTKLLNEHFERIQSEMHSEESGMEPVEQVPMMENEHTKGLKRR
jgi:hypothetical protein